MKIYLREIKEVESTFQFTEKHDWVNHIIAEADEAEITDENSMSFSPPGSIKKRRTIHAEFHLKEAYRVYTVTGKIDTHLVLLCSRCATRYPEKCHSEFQLMFSKDGLLTASSLTRSVMDSESDITLLKDDFIDLGIIVAEQVQLQVPVQPLCRKDCKGICPQCGSDWNRGQCACRKLSGSSPFSVLKDFKPVRKKN